MGNFSSWRTRVKKGILKSPPPKNDATGTVETLGAGEGTRKHNVELPDEETCADEDD